MSNLFVTNLDAYLRQGFCLVNAADLAGYHAAKSWATPPSWPLWQRSSTIQGNDLDIAYD